DQPAGLFDTTKLGHVVTGQNVPSGKSGAAAAGDDSSLITGLGGTPSVPLAGDTIVGRNGSATTAAIDALRASNARPGGLPAEPRKAADSSRDAAAEALRKFFEKR
ncbi:MAG: hypothetical protein ACK6CT_08515, partial [Planctomycetia bacterium]